MPSHQPKITSHYVWRVVLSILFSPAASFEMPIQSLSSSSGLLCPCIPGLAVTCPVADYLSPACGCCKQHCNEHRPHSPRPPAPGTATRGTAGLGMSVLCSGCFQGWRAALGTVSGPTLPIHHACMCPCLVAEVVASLPSPKNGATSPDPFESQPLTITSSKPSSARKTPESFLGPNAALVNLDSLVTRPALPAQSLNPFLAPGTWASQHFLCSLLFLGVGLRQASLLYLCGLLPLSTSGEPYQRHAWPSELGCNGASWTRPPG